jgi:hypothetical protein
LIFIIFHIKPYRKKQGINVIFVNNIKILT